MKRFALVTALLATIGGTAFVFAGSPSTPTAPPSLADPDRYLTNTATVTLPGGIAEVRQFMDENTLTEFLKPSGRIPRIENIEVLSGTWGEVDTLRRVDLEGGHTVHERVLRTEPDAFTYQIWDITTPSGRFINHIHGEILFTQADGDTTITWNYNVKPSVFFARGPISTYLEEDFAPFMENGLADFGAAYIAAQ